MRWFDGSRYGAPLSPCSDTRTHHQHSPQRKLRENPLVLESSGTILRTLSVSLEHAMPIPKRKHLRSETLLFVLSGAALVVVFAPVPGASSTRSDRLDEVPVVATTPQPGATIDADRIPSGVDTPAASRGCTSTSAITYESGVCGEIGVAAGLRADPGAERESARGSNSGSSAGRR
jgi:hypothetical protein